MKFVVIGDVHLSDKPPGSRKDTWAQDILDKLAFVLAQAKERGCEGVVQLGDLF